MRGQKGSTLIELVVALSLAGVIGAVSATAIFHLVRANDSVQATLQVLHSLDMGYRWVTRDVQMADSTDLVDGAPPADVITLYSREAFRMDTPLDHTTVYTFSGNGLQRDYDGQVHTVASGLTSAAFSLEGQNIVVVIGSAEEQRTFRLHLRAQ